MNTTILALTRKTLKVAVAVSSFLIRACAKISAVATAIHKAALLATLATANKNAKKAAIRISEAETLVLQTKKMLTETRNAYYDIADQRDILSVGVRAELEQLA